MLPSYFGVPDFVVFNHGCFILYQKNKSQDGRFRSLRRSLMSGLFLFRKLCGKDATTILEKGLIMQENKSGLLIGVDEKIGVGQAFLLGLQHVLAMDLYLVPIIIAGILAFSTADTAFFIQMSFIAAGIATIIQTKWGIKLPVVQGPSYVPIGALAAIGGSLGLGAMIGSLIPGAIIIALLGSVKVFAKLVRRFIPPIVGGTVIVVVGISLMPVAMGSIYGAPGNFSANCLVGFVSAALLVACMMVGHTMKKAGHVFRLTSIIIALAGGTLLASCFGSVDFSPVAKASWFALPKVFPFGMPQFNLSACITMVFIYLVVLVETTGTWFTVSAVTDKELTDNHLNRAAIGEGIGCFVGALFGGTPMTGYSTNAGIIAITGVGSRMAIMASGAVLIILGMMPKLMNVIACIPGTVINGVFAVVCVVIALNGFKVIQKEVLHDRNMMVVGLPILATLAVTVLPKDALQAMPSFLNYFLSSGIAVGAVTAVVLNLILPGKNWSTASDNVADISEEKAA